MPTCASHFTFRSLASTRSAKETQIRNLLSAQQAASEEYRDLVMYSNVYKTLAYSITGLFETARIQKAIMSNDKTKYGQIARE